MCGIFGWNWKSGAGVGLAQREAMAASLAVANSLRGDESWGVVMLRPEGMEVRKEVGDICGVKDVAQWGHVETVMAHTRYSTKGKVTRDNAHPFQVGKYLLAHNGVIYNHDELNKKHDRSCEVDSMHLVHHMAEGKPFSDVEGYGSIEWIEDDGKEGVYLCRMSGGSLAIAGINDGSKKQLATVWSSDSRHLRRALDAAGVHYFIYQEAKEGEILNVTDGKLWETKRKEVKLAERAFVSRSFSSWGWDGEGSYFGQYDTVDTKKKKRRKTWFERDRDAPAFIKHTSKSDEELLQAFAKSQGMTQTGNGLFITQTGEVKSLDEVEMMFWNGESSFKQEKDDVDEFFYGEFYKSME